MKILTILFLLVFSATQAYSQTWYPLDSGTNNTVRALTHKTFVGLIAGGDFSTVGGTRVNKIAGWVGQAWYPLGIGIDTAFLFGSEVLALTTASTDSAFHLYVGGAFSSAGADTAARNIAMWNGYSTWSPLGNGLGGYVSAILSLPGTSSLYAGGAFQYVRYGVPARFIAKWNGSSWDTLHGGNNLNAPVLALTFFDGDLIAGGEFSQAGNVNTNFIAKWNGSSWTPLGIGMDGAVNSFTIFNGYLIAGGNFTHAGGVSANYIAKWDGSVWSALGSGPGDDVAALTVFNNNLIAGTSGGYSSYHYIAKWDGNSWSSLGNGVNGNVYALSGTDFYLYVGGSFTSAGGISANYIACWLEPGNMIHHKNTLNKSIGGLQTTEDTISLDTNGGYFDVNSLFYINDVNVIIDTVNYPRDSDLEFYLIHQSVTDTLIYQAGGTGANFRGTTLNDSTSTLISNGSAPFTGSFRPYKPLSQFQGLDPGGAWILKVYDRGTGNTGTLEAWSLDITYGTNPIGIKPISSEVPNSFKLVQNYPNPFNPSTKINFALPKPDFVKLVVYDILGREVATLVNESLKPGTYEVEWNASNFSSGVYFYRLETDGYIETKKMIVVK